MAVRHPPGMGRPRRRPATSRPASGSCCWGPAGRGSRRCWPGSPGSSTPARTGPARTGPATSRATSCWTASRPARSPGRRSGRPARTGLLLQDPLAQTVLARCGDDVAFGLENHAVPAGRDLAAGRGGAARRAVPVRARAHPTARLSGGERQRLALAGVLALRPGAAAARRADGDARPARRRAMLREQVAGLLAAHRRDLRAGRASGRGVGRRSSTGWSWLARRAGSLADGPPAAVLAAHGAAPRGAGGLGARVIEPWRAAGRSGRRRARRSGAGEVLLEARGLAAAPPRPAGHAARRWSRTSTSPRSGPGPRTLPGRPQRCREVDARPGCSPGWSRPPAGEVAAAPAAGRGPARARTAPLAAAGAGHPDRHRLPGAAAPVRRRHRGRRARGRPARGSACPTAEVERRVDELLDRLRLERTCAGPTRSPSPAVSSAGCRWRPCSPTRPGVLVLDEPTFGQDARTWAELVALLERARRTAARRGGGHARRGRWSTRSRPDTAPAAGPAATRCRGTRWPEVAGVPMAATRPLTPGGSRRASRPAPTRWPSSRSASAISLALVLTVDPVTAGTALALELAALPWCGLSVTGLIRAPLVVLVRLAATVAAAALGVTPAGCFGIGPSPSPGSAARAAIALRILAIALPGVVLLATTDPTDLADALAQVLRLPHRFVLLGARRDAAGRRPRRGVAGAHPGAAGPRPRRRRPARPAADHVRARSSPCSSLADPARHRAGDRDGGARVRRGRAAHLGPAEPVPRDRRPGRCSRCGRGVRRHGGRPRRRHLAPGAAVSRQFGRFTGRHSAGGQAGSISRSASVGQEATARRATSTRSGDSGAASMIG